MYETPIPTFEVGDIKIRAFLLAMGASGDCGNISMLDGSESPEDTPHTPTSLRFS